MYIPLDLLFLRLYQLARKPSFTMLSSLFCLALSAASVVSAAPLERRAVIDHDAVVGFAETVPTGTAGELYLK